MLLESEGSRDVMMDNSHLRVLWRSAKVFFLSTLRFFGYVFGNRNRTWLYRRVVAVVCLTFLMMTLYSIGAN